MKSLHDVQTLLSQFEKQYGVAVMGAQQGSAAWLNLKLGVISASNASKAVAGKDTDTRSTYMAELVAQVATGLIEELSSKHLDWGNEHEDAARASYEFTNNAEVIELPFAFKDSTFRTGCSPDGLVNGTNKGLEIKCPSNSTHFIRFLCDSKIKPEYRWQYQFTCWVMGAEKWDFVQYDPRVQVRPLHALEVVRDEECMKKFDDLIPEFIHDMDKMLAKVGVTWGEQWHRIANTPQPAYETETIETRGALQ